MSKSPCLCHQANRAWYRTRRPQGKTLEFKRDLSSPKPALHPNGIRQFVRSRSFLMRLHMLVVLVHPSAL
jgi:hypothetical protein